MDRKYRLTSLKIDRRSCDMSVGILSIHQGLTGHRSWDVVVRLAQVDPRIVGADSVDVEMTTERGVFSGRAALVGIRETTVGGWVFSRVEFRGSGSLTKPYGS